MNIKIISMAAAAVIAGASMAACGGGSSSGHAKPAEPAAVLGMTAGQAEIPCMDMNAVSEHALGYSDVIHAAEGFGAEGRQQAQAAVAYVVGKGCPRYRHLIPAGGT